MSRCLLTLASVLVLATGCGFLWDTGDCGPPTDVDLDELDDKPFLSEATCHEDYEREPRGPIEMRIDMEEKRVFISYDGSYDWDKKTRIEEVWRFD